LRKKFPNLRNRKSNQNRDEKAAKIRKYILITDKEEKPDIKGVDAQYEEFLASASPLDELPDLDENIVVTLSNATGTTGRLKGVFFTQRQLTRHTLAVGAPLAAFGNYGGVSKHSVYMLLMPMFHVHAWGFPKDG
jgi:fatty-acyl-CoA synthase